MEATTTTTTKSNVQIIQEGFNEFLQGNIAAIIDLCSDDVQWSTYKVPNIPFSGTFYGKEGVQQYLSQLGQNINFTAFELKEFIAQGDRVMVLVHNSGTATTTGKSFDNHVCFSFKLREGKITEYFAFYDSYETFKCFQE